jgi:hypothetical protein
MLRRLQHCVPGLDSEVEAGGAAVEARRQAEKRDANVGYPGWSLGPAQSARGASASAKLYRMSGGVLFLPTAADPVTAGGRSWHCCMDSSWVCVGGDLGRGAVVGLTRWWDLRAASHYGCEWVP